MAYSDVELKQGEHLWSCAELLREQSNYNDWYAVTAFYSALHFCRSILFYEELVEHHPENGQIRYTDFEHYCGLHIVPNRKSPSRHQLLKRLVERHHRAIYAEYVKLYTTADASRYTRYEFGSDEIGEVYRCVFVIRKYVSDQLKS